MQAEDIVYRKALDSVGQSSQSAQALAIFLAVKAVLTGQKEFSHAEIVSDGALRRVYDELREEQALLLESAQDDEASGLVEEDVEPEDEDDPYFYEDEEEVPRVAEFEPQITEDLETLEGDLIERDTGSGTFALKTDQLIALSAVISDALARYDYSESELRAYMLSIIGILD
jgi:hypothetical protein